MRLTKRDIEERDARKWQRRIANWHPAKINTLLSLHWAKRQKIKAADRNIIFTYFKNVPVATCKRRVELFIGLGHRQRGGDPDAYWKSLLDALVQAELLIDDSKEYVELAPVQYYRNGEESETLIILSDIIAMGSDIPQRRPQVDW